MENRGGVPTPQDGKSATGTSIARNTGHILENAEAGRRFICRDKTGDIS